LRSQVQGHGHSRERRAQLAMDLLERGEQKQPEILLLKTQIRATEANLTKITDKMIVIPGHGEVANKSQLSFYRDLLVTVRDRVVTLKKQGRSVDEVVAANPIAPYDTKWGVGFMSPRMFTGLVFEGV
jgi:hypothetical protein